MRKYEVKYRKLKKALGMKRPAFGHETSSLGYESSRLWVRNVQTAGYESSNLGTNCLGYETFRVWNDHNSLRWVDRLGHRWRAQLQIVASINVNCIDHQHLVNAYCGLWSLLWSLGHACPSVGLAVLISELVSERICSSRPTIARRVFWVALRMLGWKPQVIEAVSALKLQCRQLTILRMRASALGGWLVGLRSLSARSDSLLHPLPTHGEAVGA